MPLVLCWIFTIKNKKMKLVSNKTAILAEQKRFNYQCDDVVVMDEKNKFLDVNRPTQSKLQTWLRNEHEIIVLVIPINILVGGMRYSVVVHNPQFETLLDGFTVFEKYEDALEEGLYESLKLIREYI